MSRSIGPAIRDYLLEKGDEGAGNYEVWKAVRAGSRSPTYASFKRYFYCIKQLELVKLKTIKRNVRPEGFPGKRARVVKYIYTIDIRYHDSPLWDHPEQAYNPLTNIGGRRYQFLKELAEEQGKHLVDLYYELYPDVIEKIVSEFQDLGWDINTETLLWRLRNYGRTIHPLKRFEKKPTRRGRPKKVEEKKPEEISVPELWDKDYNIQEISDITGKSRESVVYTVMSYMKDQGISDEVIAETFGITTEDVDSIIKAVEPEEEKIVLTEADIEGIVNLWESYDRPSIESVAEMTEFDYDVVRTVLIDYLKERGMADHVIEETLGIEL